MPDAPPPPHSKAEWRRRPSPEERAAELARDERLVRRDIRNAFLRALVACVLSLLVGLGCMALGFRSTDPDIGQIWLLSGLVLGYTGLVVTLARFYLRGESQGWWH